MTTRSDAYDRRQREATGDELSFSLACFDGQPTTPETARAMERHIRRFMVKRGLWEWNDHAVVADDCSRFVGMKRQIVGKWVVQKS